ncbi:unnamed protein product [Lactuca saligna]|uniref:Uncharacterized protein n=1 Tax=Lactuca saligna TaxID=75948 RepID=A0AA35YRK6_LACSI|nr:unnamed protein product [Lactuca saligna]
MPTSSFNKKLHYFNMPDELKWPSKERNQRLPRGAPMRTPPVSEQPRFKNHSSNSTSTEVDIKSKPAKLKEPNRAGNHGSKVSSSKVPSEGENPVSKNKMCEDPENEKPKLLITLTREEIEEDYLAMTGKKLPRNKMRRDKSKQKDLDVIFPGVSLEGRNAENLAKKY